MSSAICDTRPAYDHHGKIVFMARSCGYVMARRPRCIPFVLSEKEWRKLPKDAESGASFGIGSVVAK